MVRDEVVYAQTVKYEFGRNYHIKGKDRNLERRIYLTDNEHIATFSRMLVTLGYTGTCCVNYKVHNELPMLMEINPRFGASLVGDINRYLEAYLSSLGAMDKSGFQGWNVSRASDKSLNTVVLTPMRRAMTWLLSRMPYRMWYHLRAMRNTGLGLLARLSALMRINQAQ
jgi:hypothetical protein